MNGESYLENTGVRLLESFVEDLESVVDNAIIKVQDWNAQIFNKYKTFPVTNLLKKSLAEEAGLMGLIEKSHIAALYLTENNDSRLHFCFLVRSCMEGYTRRSFLFESYKKVSWLKRAVRFLSNSFQYDLEDKLSIIISRQKTNNLLCYSKEKSLNGENKIVGVGCKFPFEGDMSDTTLDKLTKFYDFLKKFKEDSGL